MATFKHKNGGFTTVRTEQNINALRNNKDYTEIKEGAVEESVKQEEEIPDAKAVENTAPKSKGKKSGGKTI